MFPTGFGIEAMMIFFFCIVVLLVVIVFFADLTIGNDKYVFTGVHK